MFFFLKTLVLLEGMWIKETETNVKKNLIFTKKINSMHKSKQLNSKEVINKSCVKIIL